VVVLIDNNETKTNNGNESSRRKRLGSSKDHNKKGFGGMEQDMLWLQYGA